MLYQLFNFFKGGITNEKNRVDFNRKRLNGNEVALYLDENGLMHSRNEGK